MGRVFTIIFKLMQVFFKVNYLLTEKGGRFTELIGESRRAKTRTSRESKRFLTSPKTSGYMIVLEVSRCAKNCAAQTARNVAAAT